MAVRAVVLALAAECTSGSILPPFSVVTSLAPGIRSYLRREKWMMMVGNWNPRVLRLFCSILFPFRAAPKQILVFWKRFSRTLAMVY